MSIVASSGGRSRCNSQAKSRQGGCTCPESETICMVYGIQEGCNCAESKTIWTYFIIHTCPESKTILHGLWKSGGLFCPEYIHGFYKFKFYSNGPVSNALFCC